MALLGLSILLLNAPPSTLFASYQTDMVGFIRELEAGRESLQPASSHAAEIQRWMEANAIHQRLPLPRQLTEDSGVGCRVIDWNGRAVALAGFRIGDGQIAPLLVIDRSHLSGAPDSGTRAFVSLNGLNHRGVVWRGPALPAGQQRAGGEAAQRLHRHSKQTTNKKG